MEPIKEDIKRLYNERNLSLRQTAKLLSISLSGLTYRMAKYAIPCRKPTRVELSRKVIEELYYKQNLSLRRMAKELSVSASCIREHMMKYDIPRRNRVTKNRNFTPSWRKKISLAMKGKVAWNKGLPRTIETKQKLSAMMKGKKRSAAVCKILSASHKGKRHSDFTKQKMSKIAKEKNYLLNNILNNSAVRPTKPENFFLGIIRKHNLPFRYTGDGTFWIGRLNPDFVEVTGKKIAIEVFGDYWHSPLRNRKIRYYSTVYGRKALFRKEGWELLVFWESELVGSQAESIVLKRLEESLSCQVCYTIRSY